MRLVAAVFTAVVILIAAVPFLRSDRPAATSQSKKAVSATPTTTLTESAGATAAPDAPVDPTAQPIPQQTSGAEWEQWKAGFFSRAESGEPTTVVREVAAALSDSRREVRLAATEGAVRLPPDEGLPLLARALQDADPDVRSLARDYVNYQFDEDVVATYASALSVANETVAREILTELNWEPTRDRLAGLLSQPGLAGSTHDALIADQLAAWLGNPEGRSLRSLAEIRAYWDEHEAEYGPDLEPVIDRP